VLVRHCEHCDTEFPIDGEYSIGETRTEFGLFGAVRQTIFRDDGTLLHSCPPLSRLLAAGRSLREELLVRALEGPIDPRDVIAAASYRNRINDRYLAVGLALDVLTAGLMLPLDIDANSLTEEIVRLLSTDGEESVRLVLTEEGALEAQRIVQASQG